MKKEFISPKGVSAPIGLSRAIKAGSTIYLSGTSGRDEQRNVVEGGFEAQLIKAFENIKLTLEAAGASLKDVVKLTTYLTNRDDIDKFREIKGRFFTAPMPTSTAVEVPRLAPGVLVEVDVVAVVERRLGKTVMQWITKALATVGRGAPLDN